MKIYIISIQLKLELVLVILKSKVST